MCGYEKCDLGGLDAFKQNVISDDLCREKIQKLFEETLEGKISGPTEFTFNRKDKEIFHTNLFFAPVANRRDATVAVAIIMFDVSELKRLEMERGEMQMQYINATRVASLGELASGIAHSINNPLAGILGYLGLLADEYPDDDRIRKCILQGKRIGELTQNLAYHGRNALLRSPVATDLNELVRETLLLISSSKLYQGFEMTTSLAHGTLTIKCNPGDITLILINLLRNSRDALWGRSGGRVKISTKAVNGSAVITIKDNGVGMSAEVRERIFEPFFTTKPREPTADRSPWGNGLGLSTSKHLVEKNGGRIEFETEESHGTTFNLIFPISK